jgi:hypothetical protein
MSHNQMTTICGYELVDVRRSLRDAIDQRNRRAANRWTAELVATPGAVGSLWASYWLAWVDGAPTLPILLRQSWATVEAAAQGHGDWVAFRNDPDVRAAAAEMTTRLLNQPRPTPVVWPTKDITLYDIGVIREQTVPAAADSRAVMSVWKRGEDDMEIRILAGRWLTFLETGDTRSALSIISWTMMPAKVKCAARGPLLGKARTSAIWFWLELGRSVTSVTKHRGWPTMCAAISHAFETHWKRWTASERMRVLLAWVLQLRTCFAGTAVEWAATPVDQRTEEIDLPYKEVAAELAGSDAGIRPPQQLEPQSKSNTLSKSEAKMAAADAALAAMLGIED